MKKPKNPTVNIRDSRCEYVDGTVLTYSIYLDLAAVGNLVYKAWKNKSHKAKSGPLMVVARRPL